MHRRLLLAAALALLAAPAVADDGQIIPGERAGPITAETSEQDLIQLYGQNQVFWREIDLGEGVSEFGTVIFPHDPQRKAEILWQGEERRYPYSVAIHGDQSIWTLPDNIVLGTHLQELERLNGGPFLLTGFGWDYGGTITSWEGGRLGGLFEQGSGIALRLGGDTSMLSVKELARVSGDVEYRSDDPLMQTVNPKVIEIVVFFPERE